MKNENEMRAVEIFAGIVWQAEMVKDLLENAGIEAFLQNEVAGSLNLPWDSSGGVGLVKVIIADSDYEVAKVVVDEYQQKMEEEKLEG